MIKVFLGCIFGMLVGALVASHVYKLNVEDYKRASHTTIKRIGIAGTFEHEVKRTE